jgi:hypothetical protein
MEHIYFIWWLKYIINSPDKDELLESLPEVIQDMKKDMPDFALLKELLKHGESLIRTIKEHLYIYEKTGDAHCINTIKKSGESFGLIMNEIYRNLEFYRKFTPIKEDIFLQEDASRSVISSSVFKTLEYMITEDRDKEKILDCLDKLRDMIFELQEHEEGNLADLLDDKDIPPDIVKSLHKINFIFNKGINNIEEGLNTIEKSLQKEDMDNTGTGLEKIREGLAEIKIIEMLEEIGGSVR